MLVGQYGSEDEYDDQTWEYEENSVGWYYMTCDTCGTRDYPEENPFVEVRIPRPSDRTDMSCILAGHKDCFGGFGETVKTPQMWAEWIEDEGMKAGYMWLS